MSNLLSAFDAWYGFYFQIEQVIKEPDWEESFHSNYPNPESLVIIKDEFEHLSGEAKEVVGLIYNAPYTILQLFSTRKRENITIGSIENFLVESGWPRPRINRVFKELKNFTKNL